MLKKHLKLLLILILLICISGCNPGIKGMDREVEAITIKIVDTRIQEREIVYTLKLKNGSSYIIKQNAVYLSYPIILSPSSSMTNKCKVEATGNKLDIKPDEEVLLTVIMPNECFKNNPKIDSLHPSLEINGYFDKVTQSNHFTQSGASSMFDK